MNIFFSGFFLGRQYDHSCQTFEIKNIIRVVKKSGAIQGFVYIDSGAAQVERTSGGTAHPVFRTGSFIPVLETWTAPCHIAKKEKRNESDKPAVPQLAFTPVEIANNEAHSRRLRISYHDFYLKTQFSSINCLHTLVDVFWK